MKNIHYHESPKVRIWVAQHEHAQSHPYVSETFLRAAGGVYHEVQCWKSFKPYLLPDIELSCRQHGIYSPRPYRPGQRCDGSITTPVLYLFDHFLRQHGLDPLDSYHKAFEKDRLYTAQEWQQMLAFAQWQGVAAPRQWDTGNYPLFIESLTQANQSGLVDLLLRLSLFPNPFSP